MNTRGGDQGGERGGWRGTPPWLSVRKYGVKDRGHHGDDEVGTHLILEEWASGRNVLLWRKTKREGEGSTGKGKGMLWGEFFCRTECWRQYGR